MCKKIKMEIYIKVTIILLIFHAIVVFAFWVWALNRPHMVDPIEVRVANIVALWRNGYLPYNFADRLPAVWNPYGPLYEWLCAFLNLGSLHPYWNGRLLSLLAFILIVFSIVSWAWKYSDIRCGLLSVLLLLTSKPIFSFGHLYRVDMLGVAFSVLGFVLTISWNSKFTRIIGIFMMILAFHVKITFVAAPIACTIIMFRQERFKALSIAIGWLTGAIAGFLLLQWWTDGAYLFQAKLANLPTLWTKPLDMLTRPLTSSLFWMLALILWCRTSKLRNLPEVVYCLCSLAVAGITSTNPGSSWNYLIEFYTASALLSGRVFYFLLTHNIKKIFVVLFLCHSIFSIIHTTYFIVRDVQKVTTYKCSFEQAKSFIKSMLPFYQKIVIFESLTGMDALLSFGKFNFVDLPRELQQESKILLQQALIKNEIDLVLIGDDLIPMKKESQKR